jgi:hypothetical protein
MVEMDGATYACTSCSAALTAMGTRLVCPSCQSCLVPLAEVDNAMEAVSHARERAALHLSWGRARPCPRCAHPMAACTLNAIPVDHCQEHGVWFDRDELQQILFAAATAGGAAVAAAGATNSGGDASGIADVFEVIVEVLAGIVGVAGD